MLPVLLLKIRTAVAPGMAKEHTKNWATRSARMAMQFSDVLPGLLQKERENNPFLSVLFCSLLLEVNGELCLTGAREAVSQRGCSSSLPHTEQTMPGWEMALHSPQGCPSGQVISSPALMLPVCHLDTQPGLSGETHGMLHHTISCQQVQRPPPSPAPLLWMISALPELGFKREGSMETHLVLPNSL